MDFKIANERSAFGLSGAQSDADANGHTAVNSNESVMDADLRQTNRLNVELLVLQNAAQSFMCPKTQSARWARSRSLGNAGGIPQSGVLAAASGFRAAESAGAELQLQRQLSLSGGAAKSRTNSEHDSGVAGLLDSRKSSLGASGAVFGQQPSLRLRVRPLRRAAAGAADEPRRSILGSLAAIGRSASREGVAEPEPEPAFEIQLLEARNVARRGAGGTSLAPTAEQAAPGAHSRRDSLLGALVAATSGAQRRHSVEGVFVRVFKRDAPAARPPPEAAAAGANCDSLSIHSAHSVASNVSGASGAHFLQLPLVRAAGAADSALSFGQTGGDEAAAGAYAFQCRASEFPLRISLYEQSKRGGARFTLGHCFVAHSDWLGGGATPTAASDPQQQQPEARQAKFALLEAKQADESSAGAEKCRELRVEAQLEYRLYETILEAIPQ